MNSEPIVVAVASGKGGVGKTMFSVALSHELSKQSKTLVIDLDFFNRGLTGLFNDGVKLGETECPDCIRDAKGEASAKVWSVLEVADNLLMVSYPDLSPEEMSRLNTMSVEVLRDSFGRFIRTTAQRFACTTVVLDCHGGPDNTSFAAVLIARHAILLSEPDRITFYGTLNFLRQMRQAGDWTNCDIHLVFNKVVQEFNTRFLNRIYDENLRAELDGHPLLAVFPLEVYLTKAFEQRPILSAVYPNSLLARKMAVLVYDLFSKSNPELVSPSVKGQSVIGGVVRWFRRRTLGEMPWIARPSAVVGLLSYVVVAALLLAALASIGEYISPDGDDDGSSTRNRYNRVMTSQTDRLMLIESVRQSTGSAPLPGSKLDKLIAEKTGALRRSYTSNAASNRVGSFATEADELAFMLSQSKVSAMFRKDPPSTRPDLEKLLAGHTRNSDAYAEAWNEAVVYLERIKSYSAATPSVPAQVASKPDSADTISQTFEMVRNVWKKLSKGVEPAAPIVGIWLALIFCIELLVVVERSFSFHVRQKAVIGTIYSTIGQLAVWVIPLTIFTVAYREWSEYELEQAFLPMVMALVFLVYGMLGLVYRAVRDIRYDRSYYEATIRCIVIVFVATFPFYFIQLWKF